MRALVSELHRSLIDAIEGERIRLRRRMENSAEPAYWSEMKVHLYAMIQAEGILEELEIPPWMREEKYKKFALTTLEDKMIPTSSFPDETHYVEAREFVLHFVREYLSGRPVDGNFAMGLDLSDFAEDGEKSG